MLLLDESREGSFFVSSILQKESLREDSGERYLDFT